MSNFRNVLIAFIFNNIILCKSEPEAQIVAFKPKGIYVTIPNYDIVQGVTFYGKLNSSLNDVSDADFVLNDFIKFGDQWITFDETVQLTNGTLSFHIRIKGNGIAAFSQNIVLQPLPVSVTAYKPRGLRITVPYTEGVEGFAIWANVNTPLLNPKHAAIHLAAFEPIGSSWIVEDDNVKLSKHDILYYKLQIRRYGKVDTYYNSPVLQIKELSPMPSRIWSVSSNADSIDDRTSDYIPEVVLNGNNYHPNTWSIYKTTTTRPTTSVTSSRTPGIITYTTGPLTWTSDTTTHMPRFTTVYPSTTWTPWTTTRTTRYTTTNPTRQSTTWVPETPTRYTTVDPTRRSTTWTPWMTTEHTTNNPTTHSSTWAPHTTTKYTTIHPTRRSTTWTPWTTTHSPGYTTASPTTQSTTWAPETTTRYTTEHPTRQSTTWTPWTTTHTTEHITNNPTTQSTTWVPSTTTGYTTANPTIEPTKTSTGEPATTTKYTSYTKPTPPLTTSTATPTTETTPPTWSTTTATPSTTPTATTCYWQYIQCVSGSTQSYDNPTRSTQENNRHLTDHRVTFTTPKMRASSTPMHDFENEIYVNTIPSPTSTGHAPPGKIIYYRGGGTTSTRLAYTTSTEVPGSYQHYFRSRYPFIIPSTSSNAWGFHNRYNTHARSTTAASTTSTFPFRYIFPHFQSYYNITTDNPETTSQRWRFTRSSPPSSSTPSYPFYEVVPHLIAYSPKGLRVILPFDNDIEDFYFWANINKKVDNRNDALVRLSAFGARNGLWTAIDKHIHLIQGDVVHYILFVRHRGILLSQRPREFLVKEVISEVPDGHEESLGSNFLNNAVSQTSKSTPKSVRALKCQPYSVFQETRDDLEITRNSNSEVGYIKIDDCVVSYRNSYINDESNSISIQVV